MAVNYSDALVHMVQCKIDAARSGKISPITAFEDIMELFVEHNIVRVEVVHPGLVFVHTCNRGGLGLNPHNCRHCRSQQQQRVTTCMVLIVAAPQLFMRYLAAM